MNNLILLVEDEADLSVIVADTLREQGFEVITACDGIEGLEQFRTSKADIVVADVMMPRMDGFTMARKIRTLSSSVPILFLTAKTTIRDVEHGFDIGGDDYIKKPFELRELIVRIKSLLRRNGIKLDGSDTYSIGGFIFNTSRQTLSINGEETLLPNFEARTLEILASNIGKTVDATYLVKLLWQRDDPSSRNSLHGYIHKLRHILRKDPTIAIVNQRGFGYMLTTR